MKVKMQKTSKAQNVSAAAQDNQIQQKLNRDAMRKERLMQILPYAGIVILIVLFTVLSKGKFIGAENLNLLINQCFTMVIVIIGATFLYATGAMDMSVGQVLAMSSLVLTLLFQRQIPLMICLLAGIAAAAGLMCITATARNYLKLNPFIASMCISNVCSGVVSAVSKQGKIVFPYSQAPWLSDASIKAAVLAALIAAGYFLYRYSPFGKSVRSIGGSPIVSGISGIRVEKTVYLVYIVMGVTVGISAMFTVARAGVVDPTIGGSMNLNIMVALVLGGFPLSGGANARFSAPIIGSLMVTILTNGLGMLGQASALGYGIKGVLFIVVIALTYEKSKGRLVD